MKKILVLVKKDFKNIRIKEIVFNNSYEIDLNNPYLKLFSQITKEKFGIKTSFTASHGSSDACFFVEKKIPVVLIRPRGNGSHSEKEWIDLKDLEKFYLVLKEFVKTIAKKQDSFLGL